MTPRFAVLLMLLLPAVASAQQRELPPLPRDVEARVRDMQNDPSTRRMTGPTTIAAGEAVAGGLVVEGGTLHLDGRVDGDVVVIGGDLVLAPSAAVTGDVIVVGGEITGVEYARVDGTLVAYAEAGRDDDDWDDDDDDDWKDDERRDRRRHRHDGGLRLGLSIDGNYNRVEGLPVMFGPIIETRGPNALHLSGQAVWRTEPSRSLDEEIGYLVRARQRLFGGRVGLFGEASSRVHRIEARGLNSTEAGLAAVLFQYDPHDYYQSTGFGAGLEYRALAEDPLPLRLRVDWRDAEHDLLRVSDPWALFDGDDDWRPQPIAARGDITTLSALASIDTRDDDDEPVRGFLAEIGVQHALDQDLVMPSIMLGTAVGGGLTFEDFTIGHADFRLHLPVNRSATLNLRGYAAGAIDETVLPPQFQHALGGIGTLPGFSLFEGACGSRDARVRLMVVDTSGTSVPSGETMLPAYGCDRVALGQLEYRGGFGLDFGDDDDYDDEDDEEWWDYHDIDLEADWSFFVDVARGWSNGDMTFAGRGDTDTMADVGMGLLFDQAGVYAALPLTGDDHSLRVVVRLQRRF